MIVTVAALAADGALVDLGVTLTGTPSEWLGPVFAALAHAAGCRGLRLVAADDDLCGLFPWLDPSSGSRAVASVPGRAALTLGGAHGQHSAVTRDRLRPAKAVWSVRVVGIEVWRWLSGPFRLVAAAPVMAVAWAISVVVTAWQARWVAAQHGDAASNACLSEPGCPQGYGAGPGAPQRGRVG